ncbi:MAG: nucleoside triphosphate pyrophosphohydrolase [Firmicutes bacterium]|nr:nucleoside triphosphate pyrophosphohydrolase [Bacillota bacterium]
MESGKVYNKLVRDRIPEIMERQGMKTLVRYLDDKEYMHVLHEKLKEEVDEYMHGRNMGELADVLEVIHAIIIARGLTIEEVEKLRLAKAQSNGAFFDRVFLERVLTDQEAEVLKETQEDINLQY